MYLEELYRGALKKAEENGIKVNILNEEALDISEQTHNTLISSDGKKREYDQAILCLGNQSPTFGKELKGIAGYYHHAWPESELLDIPDEEDIYVIGASLTAIDVLMTLQEKGHKGTIHLVSRQGILPKVRIFAEPHELKYLTPENVKRLTDNGHRKLSLDDVIGLFEKEFKDAGVEIPELVSSSSKPAIDILREDIQNAETGNLPYFHVLKAVDEVAGEIWNSLSMKDQERFDAHYKTLWNAYDYPMPLQNARKVLAAIESGQLQIQSGFRKLEYNSKNQTFSVTCADSDTSRPPQMHEAKHVINATGQGLNIARIESTIIQNALENGTITPHLLGGVDVDFQSGGTMNARGKYSNRIYAVGSLTRGVHFYTNSINENAKCGKRTVEAVIDQFTKQKKLERTHMMDINAAKKPQKVALFIGSDISSHFLMNELVPRLIEDGYEPSVYFAKHRASTKPVLPEIQAQGFFERALLADHVYPFLDSYRAPENVICNSPQKMAEKYGITVKEVESVNAPAFISELEQEGVDAGIVVRCYQKFGKDIIGFFNQEPHNALWNLHPGILPQYRGVMTYFRSMNDAQETAGYSLHVIDENWDAGPVIDIRPEPLDLDEAMLTNYCEIAPSGVSIIVENLNKLSAGMPIKPIPQREEDKGYYTFPTREEMDEFLGKDLYLVDPAYMRKVILANFSREGTEHYNQLERVVDDAIYQEFGIQFGQDGKLEAGTPKPPAIG